MRDIEGMGEPLLVRIDDDVDVTLPPAGYSLGTMDAGLLESEPAQGPFEDDGASLIHGELDELNTRANGSGRQDRQIGRSRPRSPAQLVEHDDQRSMSVDSDTARRARPETVVEDLQG